MKKNIVIKLLVLLFSGYIACAQAPKPDSVTVPLSDTLCFKYNFKQGDTLDYIGISFDSLQIDFGDNIKKHRIERIIIACDSVLPNGHFLLSHSLIEILAKETQGDKKPIKREESQWLDRVVKIELDSLGRRYRIFLDDSTEGAVSPGGAFGPFILIEYGEACRLLNESWIVKSDLGLAENGIPIPLVTQTSFFRAKERKDTLGYKCNSGEYIFTGQGSFKAITGKDTMNLHSIMNGFGKFENHPKRGFPIHYFATIEQKLKINMSGDVEKPGKHFVRADYTLRRFVPGTDKQMKRTLPNAKEQKTKNRWK
ncbi:MAG: hypothetical protein HW421_3754 [Ignavibacteria bacterium]|nr:hypothetical protein [Ignavibacteria bacterium]